jgi:predicted nucleic acid-binding protein
VILVDSNILLDLFTEDPVWFGWSSQTLLDQAESDELAINPIIYAEVSTGFQRVEELDGILPTQKFHRLHLPYPTGFLAAKCFLQYRRGGGVHHSILPDFYIGAHAAIARLKLLTRDPRRYRNYFPTVELIAP